MSAESVMTKMNYREACKQGSRAAMNRDEKVFLMGADVGRYGGCFAVSKGLLEEYGEERIRDMPLCESAIAGIGIGVSMGGMRPIVEIMTVNFSLLALDLAILLHFADGSRAKLRRRLASAVPRETRQAAVVVLVLVAMSQPTAWRWPTAWGDEPAKNSPKSLYRVLFPIDEEGRPSGD